MMHQTGLLVQYIILYIFCVQIYYLLFFSIAGKFSSIKKFPPAIKIRKIRILIPAYKEDSVIIATTLSALQHDYPSENYEVCVIADSFDPATLATLKALPINVIEVSFENSTKGKALKKAIEMHGNTNADIILVLDADNIMAPGFLHAVNNAFEQGYHVVQGHRTANNPITAFAILDACSEEINNHIFRRGHIAVGLPAALIGSGMAFNTSLFAHLFQDIGETCGEDKEIDFSLMRLHTPIAFLDGAYIFDEKITNKGLFINQRSRWVAAQFEFLKKYSFEGLKQLFKGNFYFFNKVFQTFLLPRIILIGLLVLWICWTILFSPVFLTASLLLFISLSIALLLGVPTTWFNKKLGYALLQLPVALFAMLKAFLKIKNAGKQFIHTPHGEAVAQKL